MNERKIKSQKEIVEIAERLKKEDKIVVTRNGSFDLLHLGHVLSLEDAKKQGDVLIVLLNSDKSVGNYKGPGHPLVPQKTRARMLAALGDVDYVVIFDETTPNNILDKIKPNIHCVGYERGKNSVTKETVEKNKGKIYTLKEIPGFSTSELIKKIAGTSLKPEKIAIFLPPGFSVGLLNKVGRQLGLNLSKSWLIGDKKDVEIGKKVNLKIKKIE